MQQTLKYIIASFIGFAVMLIGLSWVSYQQAQINVEYTNAVENTQKVLLTSEAFLSSVKDIETGQRGYLITHNEAFLEPFEEGVKHSLPILDNIKELVKDNPVQKQSLDKIRELTTRKIKHIINNVDRVKAGESYSLDELEMGRKTMDSLRTRVDTFEKNESDLLQIRMHSKVYGQSLMPVYQIMLSLSSFFLLAISFYLVYSELKRRYQSETALNNKVEELNRSNAELEQFAYVASHDLQEPLRKIRAFSDKLQIRQREVLNTDGKETLDKIASSASRMQILIDDLLNFSRMVNHKTQSIGKVNLQKTLEEVVNELNDKIIISKASIEISDLPIILAYNFQIKQLFFNLLSNSLKYAREGVTPIIKITCVKVKGKNFKHLASVQEHIPYYKISVIDNGIGFEAQYCEKIFVIFQRLHNRNEYEGTGIGLAICKRVMNNHNGFIFAKSKPYEGSTFELYFPIITA